MAAAKVYFAALAELVADGLASDVDDCDMSDLHSEEVEEPSDFSVAAVVATHLSREDPHRVRLHEVWCAATVTKSSEGFSVCKDVIGATDGCHVRFTRPTECEEDYYSRKKFHSVILRAVCDAEMVFTDVFVGIPGRAHDARVLQESFLFEEAASRFDASVIHNLTRRHAAILDDIDTAGSHISVFSSEPVDIDKTPRLRDRLAQSLPL
ncbi:hypothetical protein MTO96_031474 [Rhipicephalus appendiculatus]